MYKGVQNGYMMFLFGIFSDFLQILILKLVFVILLDFYLSVICLELQCVNSYQRLQLIIGVHYTVLGWKH